eukprot:8911390-Prorocentrum_lima.AAC.1
MIHRVRFEGLRYWDKCNILPIANVKKIWVRLWKIGCLRRGSTRSSRTGLAIHVGSRRIR